MAKIGERTRLNPPLMSAFREAHRARDAKVAVDERDGDGQRVVAARRRLGTTVNERAMRTLVRHDLEDLVNTVNFGSAEDVGDLPRVRGSVLNYGLPEISGRIAGSRQVKGLADEVRRAILDFEPRLIASTVRVERREPRDGDEGRARFAVVADLRCEPAPVPIEFVADVDLADGKLKLARK